MSEVAEAIAAPAVSSPVAAAAAPAISPPVAAPAPVSAPATPAAEVKATWPDNWRDIASKGDEKIGKFYGRYGSPEAAFEALWQANKKLTSGELKPILGKNATADETAKWRSDMGIPETPDKYDVGFKVTDAQKPAFDVLFKHAHATHQTPDQLKATLQAWEEVQNMAAEMRTTNDDLAHKGFEDQLRAEWGNEYRRNWNVIDNMLNGAATPQLKQMMLESRAADGSKLGSNPDVLRFMLQLALIQNPAGVVVPGDATNPSQGLKEELAKITAFRSKDRKGYDKDDAMQARERELIRAAIKMGAMDNKGNWKQ